MDRLHGDQRQQERRFVEGSRLETLVRSRWHGPGGIRGLAETLGLTRATIYLWFRGVTRPNATTLAMLAKVLSVTPDELLAIFDADAGEAHERATDHRAPARKVARAVPRRPSSQEPLIGEGSQRTLFENLAVGAALGGGEVTSCEADDPIGAVARMLYSHDFSQLPVRDHGAWIGLLTTEAIARWLASRSSRDLGYDEAAPVRELLPYAEDPDAFRVVSTGSPASSCVELFDRAAASGRPLTAVLITKTGRALGDLLGIVTPVDLPRLRRAAR